MDSTVPPVVLRSVPSPEHRRRGPDSGRVLVLNATYEPINVCSVRRAVVLLLKDKAELLERGRWELHSESATVARPVVIRLVSYVRVPRDAHRRKITRRAVFARDGWMCQYCGSHSNLTVDHVIPRSKGGSLQLGEHRRLVRAVQPAQGRPAAAPGRHAPQARSANTAGGDLHPRRLADDPGGVAGSTCPGSVGLRRRTRDDEGRPRLGRPSHTALTGKTETVDSCCRRDQVRRSSRGVPGWIPLTGSGTLRSECLPVRSPASDLAAGHLQGPAKTVN